VGGGGRLWTRQQLIRLFVGDPDLGYLPLEDYHLGAVVIKPEEEEEELFPKVWAKWADAGSRVLECLHTERVSPIKSGRRGGAPFLIQHV